MLFCGINFLPGVYNSFIFPLNPTGSNCTMLDLYREHFSGMVFFLAFFLSYVLSANSHAKIFQRFMGVGTLVWLECKLLYINIGTQSDRNRIKTQPHLRKKNKAGREDLGIT